MIEKDLSKMAIMDQSFFQNAKNGKLVIDKDYNLNKATLVVPNGMTIDLSGGTINNGTLVLDDTLLENMNTGSIDARIEGTLRNTIIYTASIGGINNLHLSDYSDMTVYCNQNESNVNNTIIISGVNNSGNTNTVFDGMNHSFTCSSTFFSIRNGSRNVTIKRFTATAVTTATEIDFQEMLSSVGVKDITITNNTINGFRVGMSINGGAAANCYVQDCTVSYNTIHNAKGTTSGHGYGVHLANARYCTVHSNNIYNSDRHSIYHAFGDHNTISCNNILNHRSNYPIGECGVSYSAIDVARRSTNLAIVSNTISNCYSIGIIISSHSPNRESPTPTSVFPEKYGIMDNIYVINNTFSNSNNTDATNGLPSIMVGTNLSTPILPEDLNTYYVNHVEITNNLFARSSTEKMKCIRVVQCKSTKIMGNNFQFNALTTSHSRELIEYYDQFANLTPMISDVKDNTFVATQNINSYIVYCVSFQTGINNSLFDITISNNILSNQYSGTHQNYKIYKPVGIAASAGSNLHLQTET